MSRAKIGLNMPQLLKKISSFKTLYCAALISALPFVSHAQDTQEPSAKIIFGSASNPSATSHGVFGSYAKGCLGGGVALPVDGENWQAMRLSRNRNWGHPALIDYLKKLSNKAATHANWRGLLVGDLSQPRGGPMLTGHRSHQIGLDADIWLTEMPDRRLSYQEREETSAVSVLKNGTRTINQEIWREEHYKLLKTAASFDEVARIFVFPAIKAQLCKASTKKDSPWLRKIRPWYGHHYHFHVRLKCPEGQEKCINQAPPPAGAGCGKELAWWLSDEPWKPKEPKKTDDSKPKPKPQILTVAGLPKSCTAVVYAPDGPQDLTKAPYGLVKEGFDNLTLPERRPAQ